MYSYLLLAQLVANTDRLSEFDKSTAYTEQLFLLCFCKDDRQGEGHKYRSVFCIALMTLSGIPAENGIQGMVDQYFSAYSVFDY